MSRSTYTGFWGDRKRYKKARARALQRDRRCVLCGLPDSNSLTVHHLRPRSLGGRDHERNLVALCRSCHDRVETFSRRLIAWVIWAVWAPVLTLARIVAPLRWPRPQH
jgi:hypothetical protein